MKLVATNLSASLVWENLTHYNHYDVNYLAMHDNDTMVIVKLIPTTTITGGDDNDDHCCKKIVFEEDTGDNRNTLNRIKLISLQDALFLVAASSRIIKIYAAKDDFRLCSSCALPPDNYQLGQVVHSIETLATRNLLVVGTQFNLYFYSLNSNGETFKVKKINNKFCSNSKSLIHRLTTDGKSQLVIAENVGLITQWRLEKVGSSSQWIKVNSIDIHPNCKTSCMALYENLILLATISGQVQLLDATTGQLLCEIQAYAKCITGLDVCHQTGHLVTISEDSYVRLFKLSLENGQYKVQYLRQEICPNEILCGVKFLDFTGQRFAVTTYESTCIKLFE